MIANRVVYYREESSWWAEAEALPGFSALATDFESVRTLVYEALVEHGVSVAGVIELLEDGVVLLPTWNQPFQGPWWSFEGSSTAVAALRPASRGVSVSASEAVPV